MIMSIAVLWVQTFTVQCTEYLVFTLHLYHTQKGPYKECGTLFTKSSSIGPKLCSIGVFYDDPKQVPSEKCRYAVGSILSEGDGQPCQELLHLYQKSGFRVFSFPEVTHVVKASFPHRTPLSVFLGVQRVYPKIDCYIKAGAAICRGTAPGHSEAWHGGHAPRPSVGQTQGFPLTFLLFVPSSASSAAL
ncbi:hypothetical protein COCON_G00144810 [Conger conger]|uniref:Uncharacterized protein n=1 Tax=Conger conger TaxID=82655 RepID=A0A9Q1HUA6_CONCO|nr:hypothetical protein COCON_G00144810 [Conger conger]